MQEQEVQHIQSRNDSNHKLEPVSLSERFMNVALSRSWCINDICETTMKNHSWGLFHKSRSEKCSSSVSKHRTSPDSESDWMSCGKAVRQNTEVEPRCKSTAFSKVDEVTHGAEKLTQEYAAFGLAEHWTSERETIFSCCIKCVYLSQNAHTRIITQYRHNFICRKYLKVWLWFSVKWCKQ